jgi:hypothetical protein
MFIYIHIRSYYMLFLDFSLFLRVMLCSLICLFTSISVLITCCSLTLACFLEWCCVVSYVYLSKKQAKVKEQHVIRTDMDVNKHERLHNITLRNKLKSRNSIMLFLYFSLFLRVMLCSFSCLFTSIYVLITCCSFTLPRFLEWCCVVSHVYLHPYPFLLHAIPLL